ncbi:GntR family transcriptional regulator [Puia sp.]|jgi:DNA-binding transcriptional regulator YhcF (GntR family)|uniref:GntR family transcriptional regulator n=1 Tax=Puia sp. TaxID=2045100 RepID=UPI002F3F1B17
MEFREKGSIYSQIAEYVCDQILLKKWLLGEKIPSIREFAATMQVNAITVQRAYDFLLQLDIIANKRGIGYFVTPGAEEKVLAFRRAQFIEQDLPLFVKNMRLLRIDPDEIKAYLENAQNKI